MSAQQDRAAEILNRYAAVPSEVKAQAWQAYTDAKDEDDLARRIDRMALPQAAKAALWEAKYSEPSGVPVDQAGEYFATVNGQPMRGTREPAGTIDGIAPEPAGPVSRFVSNAVNAIKPWQRVSDIWEGPAYAVRHPIDSAKLLGGAILGAQKDQFRKAGESFRRAGQERTVGGAILSGIEATGHGLAGALPVLGPAAAHAGEQIAQGDIAGGLGTATGLLAPSAAVKATPQIRSAAASVAGRVANAADRGATKRMVQAMAPVTGAKKAELAGMAQRVAPELAREPGLGAFSRSSLAAKLEERLADAGKAINDAFAQIPANRGYATGPILAGLQDARAKLMVVGSNGKRFVPAESQARFDVITQAINDTQRLGQFASFENLNRVRQSLDAGAKKVYQASPVQRTTADLERASALADSADVYRQYLGQKQPSAAKANADYSLFKTATDVIRAAENAELTRAGNFPRMLARTGGALTGAAVGGAEAGASGGVAGAAIGMLVSQAVESAARSGATGKVFMARRLAELADALRKGQTARANTLQGKLWAAVKETARTEGPLQVGTVGSPTGPLAGVSGFAGTPTGSPQAKR